MDEALEEHHVAHMLINELQRKSGNQGRHEAKFKVLGESIKHHIKEEEGTMFPKAEKADVDWQALEQKSMERKAALMENKGSGEKTARKKTRSKTKLGRRSKAAHLRKAA
jgi:hypothetical protein